MKPTFGSGKIFKQNGLGSFSKGRFFFLLLFFVLNFAALYYRAFYLHVVPDRRLEGLTRRQYLTKLEKATPRGNIYDADGEELAISVPTDSVAVRPSKVKNKEEMVGFLSRVLSLPADAVRSKVFSGKKYVWIKRNVTPQESKELGPTSGQKKIEGLEFVKESKRFYPNRELASQILGAVGQDGEGLGGVELYYEEYLRGDPEKETTFRDARGKTLVTREDLTLAENVAHLTLTLSKDIQYVVESELEETCHASSARACTAVVLDPKSGALLAMASYPHFNPNQYNRYDLSFWKNLAVTDSFEPGSIFKVILAAAALESGLVHPEDKFFCENGNLQVGPHVIHDHAAYGLLSFHEIIKFSSNIGTYKVAQKIGKEAFAEIMEGFGFGGKLGVDYPGEAMGQVRPVKSWQDIDFANIAFGQGISVTPLQIASAFATIANGGIRMRPYLVAKVTDSKGATLLETEPTPVKRVISEQAAAALSQMMEEVTTAGGTGTRAALPGYRVAGKTGTAQKLENGHYSHSKFMSSFVGFVPAENPQLAILVTIDEPKGQVYGGQVAAPVFRKIAWSALRELKVPPSGLTPQVPAEKSSPVIEANLIPLQPQPTFFPQPTRALFPAGSEDYSLDASNTTKRSENLSEEPKGNRASKGLGEISVSSSFVVPNFSGLPMREVLRRLDQTGVKVRLDGSGFAVAQKPSPGTLLGSGEVCTVTFQPKRVTSETSEKL